MSECGATMESLAVPGHTHVCGPAHSEKHYHLCTDPACGRYFQQRPEVSSEAPSDAGTRRTRS